MLHCIWIFQNRALKKRNIINITKRHFLQTNDLDTAFRDETETSDTENIEPISLPFMSYKEQPKDIVELEQGVILTEINPEDIDNDQRKGNDSLLEALTPNGTPIKSLPFSPSVVKINHFHSFF